MKIVYNIFYFIAIIPWGLVLWPLGLEFQLSGVIFQLLAAIAIIAVNHHDTINKFSEKEKTSK